ncbi:hypothetical protein CHS0354_041726 [Potamilus streckersoni]|uniref:Leucine-rich repeat-containing protein 14 n=1 Tax=Potamilus streckersoni TaxID=2493646 RepID=A0AAE0T166_9BIVA|nr:hypothetical protein CHS0354_041726 [Potamilus streckersoni]
MQSLEWYDSFYGPLYPLDLKDYLYNQRQCKQVKSLVKLAACKIIKDATVTSRAISMLPTELFVPLMQEAIENGRDRAIDVLVSRWPFRSLGLKNLAPPPFQSLNLLYDQNLLKNTVKKSLQYTTSIVHSFFESLKKKYPTKLRFLDLSGHPTAEVIALYLATHCMLVHNEAQQKSMISMYNDTQQKISQHCSEASGQEYQRFEVDQTFPDDTYIVKLDAFVTSDETLAEMCKALRVSSFPESRLKICLERLDATCLGVELVKQLLGEVKPEQLQGLRLKYNHLTCDNFRELAPILKTYTNLTALDLSCNKINIFYSDSTSTIMADMFQNMEFLIRLDLSNNRIKSKVSRLLTKLKRPLMYLRLCGCGLTKNDIEYLSKSHHASALQEVDLSENSLGQSIQHLVVFLQNMKLTLHVLELEESVLSDNHMREISQILPSLVQLLYLNLSGNSMCLSTLSTVTEKVSELADLQIFRVSFSRECYSHTLDAEQLEGEAKETLKKLLTRIILSVKLSKQLVLTLPNLIMSELEMESI